ncbi:TM0106 family RecB-like putative nuclease [Patescibacteria group bacterium]|nr:TM0106 family RecB-like putative nuclease [Patescibacteria group bacterium]
MYTTASKLYDFLQCEHKVWRDVYGPQAEKDPETNPFVQLLWDKGVSREKEVIEKIGAFVNIKELEPSKQIGATLEAMKNQVPLIYQGVIQYGDLRGIPDLLRLNSDGTYIPIDIKSGMGYEGVDDMGGESEPKYKKHYAAQLCLYVEVLEHLGFAHKHEAIIYDIASNEVLYDLDQPIGPRTPQSWWQFYQQLKLEVGQLLADELQNTPAYSGKCKLCPWYNSCKKWCKETHDLTNIFYVGRTARDTILSDLNVNKLEEVDSIDIDAVLEQKKKDKSFLKNIGKDTLEKIKQRTRVFNQIKTPLLYQEFNFPNTSYELYFDIEDDPTQALVYLHGVYERSPQGERYLSFVAKANTREAEKVAWKEFVDYVRSLPENDYTLYYYSPHEKTTYRHMRTLFPDVISEEELEKLFSKERAIDLYIDVILKLTDWPLSSYSLKEIARYLNFSWRDKTPSGALSIQWYNEYLADKDPVKLQRILDYNEDDCKATMVIKDFLIKQAVSRLLPVTI